MKELTIIEKAQRYNEAIERANAAHKDEDRHLKAALERIFPELKESYGKEIRKAIQIYLNWLDGRKDYAPKGEYTIKDMIAWLGKLGNINPTEDELEALRMAAYEPTKNWSEKLQSLYEKLTHCEQGEQKYIPKYKIGDYVKNTNYKGEPIYEIIYVDKECYMCKYRGKERMGDKAVMHFSFDNPYLRLVQKPAWSEEDENLFRCAIDAVEQESKVRTDGCLDEEVGKMVTDWLKSLKERYTWKPSDEQIKALHDLNLTGGISYAGQEQTLINLYNDLKKLKG